MARIAVTGAAGTVAGALIPALDAAVVGLDVAPRPASLSVERWVSGSVTDRSAVDDALAGCDAVIHLAALDDPWPLDVEVLGLTTVGQAAIRHGVGKLVYTSSNHVVGMHERDALAAGSHTRYGLTDPLRPDSLHGVAKAFGEAYCRFLAETAGLRTSCIRIGTVWTSDDMDSCAEKDEFAYIDGGLPAVRARLRKTWLFHRDLASMVHEELTAPDRFRLRYGVSDNPDRFWTRDVLVWNPRQSSGQDQSSDQD